MVQFAVAAAGVALTAITCPLSPACAQSAAADSADALVTFRENLDTIHKRDRARYLAMYVHTERLVRRVVPAQQPVTISMSRRWTTCRSRPWRR